MLSVYKKKMPSGGFNCASDGSYMEHNQPQGLSGPLIACVADVERGKGIGKKRKREGGRGERGRDACHKNPLLFISADAGVRKFLIG